MNVSAKIFSAFAAAGIVVLGSIAVAPAHATTGCPSGAFEVIPDVCQIVVTESGDVEFPSGIGRVTAVLVGGGGGGYRYDDANISGGGSGVVRYVDEVDISAGTVTVTVGAGGEIGSDGTDTVIVSGSETYTATAGTTGSYDEGQSRLYGGGNEDFAAFGTYYYSAGGAGANGTGDIGPDGRGAGFDSFSEIPGVDSSLWPNSTASDGIIYFGIGYGGAAWDDNFVPASCYGCGGLAVPAYDYPEPSNAGIDGLVVFRFASGNTDASSSGAGESGSSLAKTG